MKYLKLYEKQIKSKYNGKLEIIDDTIQANNTQMSGELLGDIFYKNLADLDLSNIKNVLVLWLHVKNI